MIKICIKKDPSENDPQIQRYGEMKYHANHESSYMLLPFQVGPLTTLILDKNNGTKNGTKIYIIHFASCV